MSKAVATPPDDDVIMRLQSVQSSAFRNLFETLKDVLCDCNIVFDHTGMRILTMDNNQCVLVSVRLAAANFEHYTCKYRLLVGINVANFFRLIKGIGNNDTFTLMVTQSESSKLIIVIENYDKNSATTYKLNQLDIDELQLEIPETDFDDVLTMPSTDFQRICRDMAVLSETVEISTTNKTLVLGARGDFAEQVTTIGQRESGLLFNSESKTQDTIHYGTFALKYLSIFAKANVMCATVDMYLKDRFPLILAYSCASLGKLLFVLGPKPTAPA